MTANRTDPPAPSELTREGILLAELDYLQACASQANEDRARVYNYFMAAAGSVALGLLTANLADGSPTAKHISALGFGVLFFVLAWLGYSTLCQLIALRLAWFDASLAMNQVKLHYLELYPDLRPALRWLPSHLPPLYKPGSVSNHLAKVVALAMGVAAGASAYAFSLLLGALLSTLVLDITTALAGAWAIELLLRSWLRRGQQFVGVLAGALAIGWLWFAFSYPELADSQSAMALAVGGLVAAVGHRAYRERLVEAYGRAPISTPAAPRAASTEPH